MLFTNLKMQRLRKYTTSNVWIKVTKGASIATIRFPIVNIMDSDWIVELDEIHIQIVRCDSILEDHPRTWMTT